MEAKKDSIRFIPRGYPLWLLVAILVYTLAGFLLLPWLLQRQVPGLVDKGLDRQAAIEQVSFNPYTLTLTLNGFDLDERDGSDILEIDELLVNLQLSSLFRWAWTFDQVRIVGLDLNFVRHEWGDNNLFRLGRRDDTDPVEVRPAEGGGIPRLIIRMLDIDDTRIRVSDLSHPTPFHTEFEDFDLEMTDLSTLPERAGQYRFSAASERGGTIDWTGTLTMNPMRLEGHVAATKQLEIGWRYIQDRVRFRVAHGTAELGFDYRLSLDVPPSRLSLSDGTVAVRGLRIQDTDGGEDLIGLPDTELSGLTVELPEGRVHAMEARMSDATLDIRRDAAGMLNLAELFKPVEQETPTGNGEDRETTPAEAETPATETEVELSTPVEEDAAAGDEATEETSLPDDETAVSEAAGQVPESATAGPVAGNEEGEADVRPEAEPSVPETDEDDSIEWTVGLDRLIIERLSAEFRDASFEPALSAGISELNLEILDISNAPGAILPFNLAVELRTGGTIASNGKIGISPAKVEATSRLENIALLPLQPLIAPHARLELASGFLDLDGKLASNPDDPMQFEGSLAVTEIETHDTIEQKKFVAWDSISVPSFSVSLAKQKLSIPEVRVDGLFGKMVIREGGGSNVADILAPDDASAEGAGEEAESIGAPQPAEPSGGVGAATDIAETAATTPAEQGFAFEIRKIIFADGSAQFADLSLPLPFAAEIDELDGEVTTIDSANETPSNINLKGRVKPYGSMETSGQLDLLAPGGNLDLSVAFRNVDMTRLTPYTGKFVGYAIKDGKLALDLSYRIQDRRLDSDNKVVIEQLTLGERMESPDAMDLPLSLAIALLKDANGRIDLDLPVEGNLDDPEFRYGGVVMKAFGNLIIKLVASPFRLLAGLVPGGGGEELQYIVFSPGSATPDEAELEKLGTLAKALQQRPQLILKVAGVYSPEADSAALREAKLDSLLAERRAAKPGEEVPASPRMDRRLLEATFLETGSRDDLKALEAAHTTVPEPGPEARSDTPPQFDEPGYLAALYNVLAGQQSIAEDELAALGDGRAQVIVDWLLTEAGLPEDRIQFLSTYSAKAAEGEVRLKFDLSAEE